MNNLGSALDWTRTSTSCEIRPSNVRVYQFHHQGKFSFYEEQMRTAINLSSIFSSTIVIPLGLEPRTHTLKVYCSTS